MVELTFKILQCLQRNIFTSMFHNFFQFCLKWTGFLNSFSVIDCTIFIKRWRKLCWKNWTNKMKTIEISLKNLWQKSKDPRGDTRIYGWSMCRERYFSWAGVLSFCFLMLLPLPKQKCWIHKYVMCEETTFENSGVHFKNKCWFQT